MGLRPSTDTPLQPKGGARPPSADAKAGAGGAPSPLPLPQPHEPGHRTSGSSAGPVRSPAASARSSFALERASVEVNRLSLEAFRGAAAAGARLSAASRASTGFGPAEPAPVSLDQLVAAIGIPPKMHDMYARLSVLPPQTPAPATLLCKLWSQPLGGVGATLDVLSDRGVLNVARLPDGSVWCLPAEQQLQLVQMACGSDVHAFHSQLLDAYISSAVAAPPPAAAGSPVWSAAAAAAALRDVPDDGYYVNNLGYHLVGAARLAEMRALLLDPVWLARKLTAGGAAGAIADFRRYLLARPDRQVKLVLEALQMSVGLVMVHSRGVGLPALLRCLLAGRLMAAPANQATQDWLAEQRRQLAAGNVAAAARGLPCCLMPVTPSLDQAGGLQRLSLRGHRGPVTHVTLTPSGTDALTGSTDGTARVWDLEIGDCVLELEGHAGPVTALAITADGSLTVTASEDGTARAYEMEKGQCLRVLAGHTSGVAALALDPWGRFVVTGGADGTVRVWELASARSIHVMQTGSKQDGAGVLCLAMPPSGRLVAAGCANNAIEVFDVVSGSRVASLAGHTNWVVALAVSTDGHTLVSASHDSTARVWDLLSGRCLHVLEGHRGRLNSVALASDSTTAATASDDGTARVWDVKKGTCRKVLTGHTSWVADVAFSPSHGRVVTSSGDGTAIAYAVDSGEVLQVLEGHSGAVHALALTHRGRFAVTVSEDMSVRVWDFSASCAHTPKWHEGRIHCLVARDGLVVATCGEDCVARLWDSQSGEFRGLLAGHLTPIRWAAFSADGKLLATASPDREIRVWDVESVACLRSTPASPGSRVKSFACSATLDSAVACLFDSSVTVWDLDSMAPAAMLQKRGQLDCAVGHTSAVNQVLMTDDGTLVVTLSKDSTARVWDAASGACLHVLQGHTDAIEVGFLSSQARLLATSAHDHTARLWDLDSGACLASVPLPAAISKLALSAGGSTLAVALSNGSLCVWQLGGEPRPRSCQGHTSEVTGMALSADGGTLVSTSLDCTARVWSTATGALRGFFAADCGLTCVHLDEVAGHVVAGTARGVVHFLDSGVGGK